jgi:hypothetical protein
VGAPTAQLAVVVDQQHAVKCERLAGFDGQAFDFQRVACGDPILFATCF